MHHPLDDISGMYQSYNGEKERRRMPRDPNQPVWQVTAARLKRVAKHRCMWSDPPTVCRQMITMFMSSTKPTRFMLALVSVGHAAFMAMPGDILTRPAYVMMKALLPERAWLLLFAAYSVLSLWNLFRRRHILISLAVNAFGLALFSIAFVSFLAAGLHPTPITVSDFFCLALRRHVDIDQDTH